MPDLTRIPASACCFEASSLQLGESSENDKSSPIRLLARSSKPIEHWYWGNVVHDISGAFGRDRIPLDFDHDTSQAIGYANNREITAEGLELSGAIISTVPGDRAQKVLADMRAGIPYEASINFGGDGIKVEEVPENESVEVNGYQFDGPGVVIREWPLRGVAVTLYGADGNTSSALMSDGATFSAEPYNQTQKDDDNMSEDAKTEEVVSEVEELAQPEEIIEAVEEEAAEGTELAEPVEAAEPEAVEEEAEEAEAAFSIAEFAELVGDWGADIAVKVVLENANPEVEKLRAELAAEKAKNTGEARPAAFASAEKKVTKRDKFAQMFQSKN